jgi:hypothetical protein
VRMTTEGGVSVAKAARDLEVNENTLHNWRRQTPVARRRVTACAGVSKAACARTNRATCPGVPSTSSSLLVLRRRPDELNQFEPKPDCCAQFRAQKHLMPGSTKAAFPYDYVRQHIQPVAGADYHAHAKEPAEPDTGKGFLHVGRRQQSEPDRQGVGGRARKREKVTIQGRAGHPPERYHYNCVCRPSHPHRCVDERAHQPEEKELQHRLGQMEEPFVVCEEADGHDRNQSDRDIANGEENPAKRQAHRSIVCAQSGESRRVGSRQCGHTTRFIFVNAEDRVVSTACGDSRRRLPRTRAGCQGSAGGGPTACGKRSTVRGS